MNWMNQRRLEGKKDRSETILKSYHKEKFWMITLLLSIYSMLDDRFFLSPTLFQFISFNDFVYHIGSKCTYILYHFISVRNNQRHLPFGTFISNIAPSPNFPHSRIVISVTERISVIKNKPRPVSFPYPSLKICFFSPSGIPDPSSS